MRSRWLVETAMAFMHDLHGNRQVFTLCHHDLRLIVDSRRVLDFHRPVAWVALMTLHYLRSQRGFKEEQGEDFDSPLKWLFR